jgi:ribosomal protein S18 acetylase RimI-like enzyme
VTERLTDLAAGDAIPDVRERIALGFAAAERRRHLAVPGGDVLEIDGLLLVLANVRDPAVNSVLVVSEPANPPKALADAMRAFAERGRPFGIDVEVGRHPGVDRAIREAGLTLLFTWQAFGVLLDRLPQPALPDGVTVEVVSDARGAAAIALIGQAAFGDGPEITEQFYAAASHGVDGSKTFVAWAGDEPVGMATAHGDGGAVGILGVAVMPAARRRDIATALTLIAARAFPGDLAWLHTEDVGARALYERLGFRSVADWAVSVRR